jgi:glucosamine-6-phosphate deaminase
MPGPACPLVLDHPERVALLAAELVANRLRARPGLRLLLPTGRTPIGMYAALRAHAEDGSLPTHEATLFQLDEYVGVPPEDERSLASYLRRELDGVGFGTFHALDGAAPDPDAEAAQHQALLDERPVDLAVLGLGRDGHVAFDEPGSRERSGTRRVVLDDRTRQDATETFGGLVQVPREAITVGLRTFLGARAIILLVTGSAKAPALQAMLEGPRDPRSPASLLRDHPRLTILCDRAAAALLRQRASWRSDRALVVLGHREPGISTEHRISAESLARLRHAARLARRRPVRAVLLTGWTQTDGLSEAEQMLTAWDRADTPALVEVAGRNTAENASRSLPLLWAVGDVRRITVVTSGWHLRAPFFFAPYRQFGLSVSFRPALAHGDWPRMLAQELGGAMHARGQRRDAFTAVRLPPDPAREP